MVRTFLFRLSPSRAQHASLALILSNQRHLYNAALQERRDAWSKNSTLISMNEQTKSLTEIRSFDDSYGGVPYNVSKWTLKRLDVAMKGFFQRVKKGGRAGFPRFRGSTRWESFGFHQAKGLRVKGNKLLFSDGVCGGLRMRLHRPIPDGAVVKSAVFSLKDGIWRVGLACELPSATANDANSVVGIDVGANFLATDSDGRHYENIQPGRKQAKRVRRAARAVARSRRGSKGRRKAVAKLSRLHRKTAKQRQTHLHGVANAIVKSGPTVIVEDLQLKNMTRSAKGTLVEPGKNVRQKAGLNRVLLDAAPGRLISMIAYKAESAGGQMIKVDPRNTSRTCSNCGTIDAQQLSRTRYQCGCGLDMQRDHNAANNIRERGLEALHEAARGLGKLNVGGCVARASRIAAPLAA